MIFTGNLMLFWEVGSVIQEVLLYIFNLPIFLARETNPQSLHSFAQTLIACKQNHHDFLNSHHIFYKATYHPDHSPIYFGFRFSLNAVRPSIRSLVGIT